MARLNQKQAGALAFVGNIEVTLTPVDFQKLRFEASVRVVDGAAVATTFQPCTDDGLLKTFGNIDDVLTWLRGAYTDMTNVNFSVPMNGITKAFVPPTDAMKDAIAKRAQFIKLKAGIADNKMKAGQKVAADVASGYDLVTAHPALQAIYAEDVLKQTTVNAIEAFYIAQGNAYDAIIVAGGGASTPL